MVLIAILYQQRSFVPLYLVIGLFLAENCCSVFDYKIDSSEPLTKIHTKRDMHKRITLKRSYMKKTCIWRTNEI